MILEVVREIGPRGYARIHRQGHQCGADMRCSRCGAEFPWGEAPCVTDAEMFSAARVKEVNRLEDQEARRRKVALEASFSSEERALRRRRPKPGERHS